MASLALGAGCKRRCEGSFARRMPSLFDKPFAPTPVGFSGHDLDRADELRRDEEALFAARLSPSARWLLLDELRPHLHADGGLYWSHKSDVPDDAEIVFLGFDRGEPRFACHGQCHPDDASAHDMRAAAMQLPAREAAIVAQARSLIDWNQRHRFCGQCGSQTRSKKGGHMRECATCRAEHFPRTDPVVIMLAVHGEGDQERCLLGRQPVFPANFYSALAGFVEHGESLEEAVRRELMEEAGVATERVAYVASQPWPFPYSLMIGAFAEATDDRIKVDDEEIEDAGWYSREEVRAMLAGAHEIKLPPPLAIAHTLIRTWVEHGVLAGQGAS